MAVCHRLGLFDIVNLFGEPPFLFSGGTSLTLEKRGVRLLSGHCASGGCVDVVTDCFCGAA